MDFPRPGEAAVRFDAGDRLAVVVPTPGFGWARHDVNPLGRVVSTVVTLIGGETALTWLSRDIRRGPDDDRIAAGWIADDSETVLAVWDAHRVGIEDVDYTLILDAAVLDPDGGA